MTQQAALFAEEPPAAKPECKLYDERFDWYEVYCKEKYAMPADWEIYHWAAKGERGTPGCFVLVEGGVYRHKISKGKRKGRPDYKKPEPKSQATLSILTADLERFKVEWSTRTGKCANCYGTGQEWNGWDHIKGNRYRDCVRCDATGSSVPRPHLSTPENPNG